MSGTTSNSAASQSMRARSGVHQFGFSASMGFSAGKADMLQSIEARQEPMSQTIHNDEDRWAAVQERRASADGAFYYSVRSTGVYCRPSCPSRRPRRENVAFHATPQEAERLGFRPCRR